MSYPYQVLGIPNANDDPSISQAQIQTNFNNKVGWAAVDHITYGATNAGTHAQVTLPGNGTAGSPTGLASTIYSAPGTADSTKSQLFFINSLSSTVLSAVKAFGFYTSGGSLQNGYNISSVSSGGTGITIFNLSTALPSTSYAVIATPIVISGGGYPNITTTVLINSTSQFSVYTQDTKTYVGIAVPGISFVVLQV